MRTREEGRTWKKKKKQKTRRKRMRENEEGRKEGVRVRVRLGVGGAIRNYCGTIDKRRLRGRTTEDSLRPSDFPSTASPPFRLFSLFIFLSTLLSFFLSFFLDFRLRVAPFHRPFASCLAHETFQTRQYVMFKCPRAAPPSSRVGRPTWNRRFFPTLYISVDAREPSKPRRDSPDL